MEIRYIPDIYFCYDAFNGINLRNIFTIFKQDYSRRVLSNRSND